MIDLQEGSRAQRGAWPSRTPSAGLTLVNSSLTRRCGLVPVIGLHTAHHAVTRRKTERSRSSEARSSVAGDVTTPSRVDNAFLIVIYTQ